MALEQGRLDVIPVGQVALQGFHSAAGQKFGPFATRDFQVRNYLFELLLRGLGADHGVGVQRITALDLRNLFHDFRHERLIDRFLHQSPGWASAHLSLVEEAKHQPFGRLFDKALLRAHDVVEIDVG